MKNLSSLKHRYVFESVHDSRMYYCLFGFVLLIFSYFVFKCWNDPLLGLHSFRQTQTAISAYYMLRGGSLLNYETPILGYPWSIPMEFPLFQYLVCLFVKLSGYALDQSGRLVSLLFFLTGICPLIGLLSGYFEKKGRLIILLVLLFVSPQYIYWSRSFMIESTALSLALWYLYLIKKYLDAGSAKPGLGLLSCIAVVGIFASITKVTTFFVYYVVAVLFFAHRLIAAEKGTVRGWFSRRNILLVTAAFVLPAVSIVTWTRYSDHIKSLNAIGSSLTSSAISAWNFGTLAQRLTWQTWETILCRSTADLFGTPWFLLVFLLLPFCGRRTIITSLLMSALYLLPMIAFTNLYWAHDYYIYANGILLIASVAVVISHVSLRGRIGFIVSIVLLLFSIAMCTYHYRTVFLPYYGIPNEYQSIKKDLDRYTSADDVLLIFGADWSSEIPYCLERRALMFPEALTTPEKSRKALENLRGYSIGAILLCDGARKNKEKIFEDLTGLNVANRVTNINYALCDVYYVNKEKRE